MIKRIPISELKPGMYVNALERGHAGSIQHFVNNLRIKTDGDVSKFVEAGYRFAHIDTEAPLIAAGLIKRTLPTPEPFPTQETMRSPVPEEAMEPALERGPLPPDAPKPFPVTKNSGSSFISKELPDLEKLLSMDDGSDEYRARFAFKEIITRSSEPVKDDEIRDKVEFKAELVRAQKIRNEAEDIVRGFMHSAVVGESIRTDKVSSVVEKMVDSVFNNQDALTTLTRLKSYDDYTFAHSVNVCILSITLGRHMRLERDALQDLGMGAILHDIGKTRVNPKVLKKPGMLTPQEFEDIKMHTIYGMEILTTAKDISSDTAYVAMQHHEKYDGSGYMKGLKGNDIHIFSKISSVSDTYDAMTSNRVYQKGLLPEDALKKLYTMRDKHFESAFVDRLIKALGIYPIGSIVELNNGEVGVVKLINHSSPMKPTVTIFLDGKKKPLAFPLEVDLTEDDTRWVIGSRKLTGFEQSVAVKHNALNQ